MGTKQGFSFSVSLSSALSTIQKAMPQVGQESEGLMGHAGGLEMVGI